LTAPRRDYLPIGDDVAAVPAKGGRLVLKVDMLVESTDVPPRMTYRMAARKSVAMCVSDFAAKGVAPDSFMIGLGLKAGVSEGEVAQLVRGFKDGMKEWGVGLVGGDTGEARELVISCTMVGFADSVVKREGARHGDLLVVTGPFGLPPSGLKILMNGAKANAAFRRAAVRSVLWPTPNLGLGLALKRYLTSAMDSSDGLARSLHALAKASGVGFELSSLPVAPGVAEFARSNGLSAKKLVLAGGEEYLIVGTLRERSLGSAKKAAARAGAELLTIGRVTGDSGQVVRMVHGRRTPVKDEGWTHLRRGGLDGSRKSL